MFLWALATRCRLKNETLLLLTEPEIDLELNWSQIWQLEYKQNNNGFRFEVGYFPQNVLQPHRNHQVFIVPTPISKLETIISTNTRTYRLRVTLEWSPKHNQRIGCCVWVQVGSISR